MRLCTHHFAPWEMLFIECPETYGNPHDKHTGVVASANAGVVASANAGTAGGEGRRKSSKRGRLGRVKADCSTVSMPRWKTRMRSLISAAASCCPGCWSQNRLSRLVSFCFQSTSTGIVNCACLLCMLWCMFSVFTAEQITAEQMRCALLATLFKSVEL